MNIKMVNNVRNRFFDIMTNSTLDIFVTEN